MELAGIDVIVETVEGGIEAAGTASYSTTNYLILGEMLEESTGEPSEDVLNDLAADAGLATTALTVGERYRDATRVRLRRTPSCPASEVPSATEKCLHNSAWFAP